MRGKKSTLLGLLVVMAALFAMTATAANAETNAKWLILDKDGTALDANNLHAAIGVSLENNDGSFLTKILGINVKILCTAMEVIGGALLGQGTIAEGRLKFFGCETFLNGVSSPACVPHTAGTAAGTIETKFLSGLLVLHLLEPSGVRDDLLKIFPSEGTVLAQLQMGATCPLGENISVNGTVFLKDCEAALLTHRVIHLFEQGPLTELWVLSKSKEHLESSLDGSGLLFLTGTHLNFSYSGDPA